MSQYEQTRRGGSGGMQPALNSRLVKAILIPIGPISEMLRIIKNIEGVLSNLEILSQAATFNLKRTERLRQSILKQAFSGRLVPQEPSDEPASVLLARLREEHPPRPRRSQRPTRSAGDREFHE